MNRSQADFERSGLRTFLSPSRRWAAAAILALPFWLTACGGPEPAEQPDAEPEVTEEVTPEAVEPTNYAVRGEVTQLPNPDNPGHQFMVRHEAVPDMVDRDGAPMPMDAMTMPFFLHEDTLLDDIAVGDKVQMDLVMDWDETPAMQVHGIEKLPADTELVFDATEDGDHDGMDHGDMDHGDAGHDDGHSDHGDGGSH